MKSWKKGDLAWYSSEPVSHQLVVVENFEQLPLVMFTVRYSEKSQGPGFPTNKWYSKTQSMDKATGKWVYYPPTPREVNGVSPSFKVVPADPKSGVINMVGNSYILQHYVDDGRPIQVGGLPEPPKGGPAPPPLPAVPASFIAQVEKLSIAIAGVGPGQNFNLNAPGVGQVMLQSGNPPVIIFPGHQPMPVQEWLSQVKKK